METERPALEAVVARQLLPLGRSWQRLADRALAELGLSSSTGWTLIHVARLGDGVKQTDLARVIGITGPSLVRLLDTLVDAGLVRRVTDARDQRIRRVSLTGPARSLLATIEHRLAALRATLLADVNDEDLAATAGVLERLARTAARLEPPRG